MRLCAEHARALRCRIPFTTRQVAPFKTSKKLSQVYVSSQEVRQEHPPVEPYDDVRHQLYGKPRVSVGVEDHLSQLGGPNEVVDEERERVYLVGLSLKSEKKTVTYNVNESLEELGRLAETAGLEVVGCTYQNLEMPFPATYIGSGKVAEVARAVRHLQVDTVIFDDELTPIQLRNLEKAFSGGEGEPRVTVCDRTALILDIFSQRAQTKEGQLQVRLAQVEYQLPRLTRMWTHLDRVGGGGQVKGTGEKQIEMDKRLLRDKAAQLRRELEGVRGHRRGYRARRSQTPIPVVALVGYTNAGKSTLMNTLTNAGVLAEDQLFATLDPTTRKVRLTANLEVLVSDTVGFIQKLPTQLVAAFRATLEEIQDAALIVHLLDITHPNARAQSAAVMEVLNRLEVSHIPLITAWNKVDLAEDPEGLREKARQQPDSVCLSGATGDGVGDLMDLVRKKLEDCMREVDLLVPYSSGELLDQLHTLGSVQDTEYTEHGVRVLAYVPPALLTRVAPFRTVPLESSPGSLSGDLIQFRSLSEAMSLDDDDDDGVNCQGEEAEEFEDGWVLP